MKSVQGARLSFSAKAMELDLKALMERLPPPAAGSVPELPVQVPDVSDAVQLDLRSLALKEVLSHAAACTARVVLPLHPRVIKLGPLSVDIPAGTAVVLQLVVVDGLLNRAATRASVEPPIQLPLGRTLSGIHVDPDGSLIVDLEGLPDLNLSMILRFKLPASVRDILPLIFPTPVAGDEDKESAPVMDMTRLEVEARGVELTAEPLLLGASTRVMPGPGTRLDVDYLAQVLKVRGAVEVKEATVGGKSFLVQGINGHLQVLARVPFHDGDDRLELTLSELDASMAGASLRVRDDAVVALGAGSVQHGSVQVTVGKETQWKLLLPNAKGTVTDGRVVVKVGDSTIPLEVKSLAVEGIVEASPGAIRLDLEVKDGSVAARQVDVDLKLLRFTVEQAQCQVAGRFRLVPGDGFAFGGKLTANARVEAGAVHAGPVEASVAAGTRVDVTVEEVSVGPQGLRLLRGRVSAALALDRGSVPLWAGQPLTFSHGAGAQLEIHGFTWAGSGTWPSLDGSLNVRATSDRCVVDERLLILPEGKAGARVEHFSVTPDGVLNVEDVTLDLET